MRKLAIVAVMFVAFICAGAGSASAENSLRQNAFGFSVRAVNFDSNLEVEDFVITGRYFVRNNLAVIAGFGLGIRGQDDDGTDVGLIGGMRYYLRTADFAPFVGGRLEYYDVEDGDVTVTRLAGEFGAEYFLGRQFSVEGSIGVGYTLTEEETIFGDVESSRFGTTKSAININYYF